MATLIESFVVFLSTYRKNRRWCLNLWNISHVILLYFPAIASVVQ